MSRMLSRQKQTGIYGGLSSIEWILYSRRPCSLVNASIFVAPSRLRGLTSPTYDTARHDSDLEYLDIAQATILSSGVPL